MRMIIYQRDSLSTLKLDGVVQPSDFQQMIEPQIERLVAEGVTQIDIDLEKVSHLETNSAERLVSLNDIWRSHGVRIRFINAMPRIEATIRLQEHRLQSVAIVS